MSKENKKTVIITVVVAVVAILILVAYFLVEEKGVRNFKALGTVLSGKEVTTDESEKIMSDFTKYYNKKERTVIYYASTDCSWCEIMTPQLEAISEEYDLDYLYVDTIKLSQSQKSEVMDKLNIEKHATPITVIVENGKVIDKLEGYVSGEKYVEFFKENKLLDEDAVYTPEQYITFVDFDEYKELISKDDISVIVIGQTTCSHCIAIKPALNSVAKNYNVTINYLNITEMDEDESDEFIETLKQIEYNDEEFLNDNSFGTPLILIVKNKKVIDYISGERTTSQLARDLKKAGVIE